MLPKEESLYHEHCKEHAKGKELSERILRRSCLHNDLFGEQIPHKEAWKDHTGGIPVWRSHLRVFGYVIYLHVPDQLRKKIDDKGDHMILVRYHSTGGYKLYDTTNRRTLISRDVTFNEIKELHQPVTGYQQIVTGYDNEKLVPTVFESAETISFEARIE